MDIATEVEQLIRDTVFLQRKSAKGWESCVHAGCDHGQKGARAGFKFTGTSVAFQCFNCAGAAVLDFTDSRRIPEKFRTVLEDFGVDKKTLDTIDFNLFMENGKKSEGEGGERLRPIKSIQPKPTLLPPEFKLLDRCKNKKFREQCEQYLINERGIDPAEYPFMVCDRVKDKKMKKWEQRLVVPIFHKDDLVFYQGRDMTDKSVSKYLNASGKEIDRDNIIGDYDIIFQSSDLPLYVMESWFDAYLLGGVALFGNQILPGQRAWLSKSYREKVYIPDRYGDGSAVALEALRLGWSISVPYGKLDERIKDVTDMIQAYGKLYTLKQIQKFTTNSETEGKIMLRMLTK